MEQKIVEILYKYAEELTTHGIIKDTDTWLWEGEFSKVAEDIVKLLATPAVSPRLFYLVEEIEEGVLQNITIGLSTYEKAKDYQERWKHRHPNAFILASLNGD